MSLQRIRTSFLRRASTAGDDGDEDLIQRLETDVQTLSERCARLETQNILVSVQQLDIFTRLSAYLLSFLSYYAYWKLLSFTMRILPSVVQETFPHLANDSHGLGLLLLPRFWHILRYLFAPLPYLYNRLTFDSVHRRFEVFVVAFVVVARTKLARWRERMFMTDDPSGVPQFGEYASEDAIWDANYEVSARYLYVSILRLKGLWTKSAQYLSSRADFMPQAYVRELKKLQDKTEATDWEIIEKKLPAKVLKELTDIDQEPLASASIGQVHTACLKATGEKVVIKVQHPHARTLLTDDFWSLKVISRILAWMEPEYKFLEILMGEWAKEARKELDFVTEARNLVSAKVAVDKFFPGGKVRYTSQSPQPFQVQVPLPISHLSTRDVLIMTFCEGSRVDNYDRLTEWGISRDAVMDGVAQIFAHMMYCTDIFNGDPHPGNIFIRPGTDVTKDGFTIVLLDFGLAKRLTETKRLAFCQMAFGAATIDFGMLLDAFRTIGIKLKRENVAEDMEGMRFFLRDMAPRKTAKRRIKAFVKNDQARMKSRKRGEKVPMESKAYPGEMFFFIRVNELLHGLGSRMSVELGYLDLLKPFAEKGLQESILASPPVSKVTIPRDVLDVSLNTKLEKVLEELDQESALVGVQLCVLDSQGRQLANLVRGHMGGVKSHIPMMPDALVVGFSCTKAVASTIAHVMVKEGYLTYDEPVCCRVWAKFCPSEEPPSELGRALEIDDDDDEIQQQWGWKRKITLRHILTHQAGMASALPPRATIKMLGSCEKCFAAFEYNPDMPEETILPTKEPGVATEYHFLSFGWLVAGTLCGAFEAKHGKKATFEDVYNEVLLKKLSPETIAYGFRPCGGSDGFPIACSATSDVRASSILQRRRESRVIGEEFDEGDAAETDEGSKKREEALKNFRGKEFLLDPRIWNCQEAIGGNVPSAGGRFSATGLAHFYHDLGSGKILDKDTLGKITSIMMKESIESILQGTTALTTNTSDERTSFGLGYQLFFFGGDKDNEPSGFGHSGVGGSVGCYDMKRGLSIGLMLNKSDGDKETTVRILRVLGEHFQF